MKKLEYSVIVIVLMIATYGVYATQPAKLVAQDIGKGIIISSVMGFAVWWGNRKRKAKTKD